MMAPVTIRPATVADHDALIALSARLADFPRPPWRTAHEIAVADNGILLAAVAAPGPDTVVLVAGPVGQALDGVVFVATTTDYFTGERHGHVEVLAVAPQAQGRGVARALMAAAESWARARGDRFITLNVFDANARARSLYARLGYLPETVHYRKPLVPEAGPARVAAAESPELTIRPDTPADADALWAILQAGDCGRRDLRVPRDLPRDAALAAWHPARRPHLRRRARRPARRHLPAQAQPAGARQPRRQLRLHGGARGRAAAGWARRCAATRSTPPAALGFRAMQFNSVVSTNRGGDCGVAALRLCDRRHRAAGLPHPVHGLVDIHVMHRRL